MRHERNWTRLMNWFLILFAAAIFVFAYFFCLRIIEYRQDLEDPILWERRGYGVMPEGPQKREFKRLLIKHGLQHKVSIVYGWPANPYYIREKDGARCAFR